MSAISIVTLLFIWIFVGLILAALWHAIVSGNDDNYPKP
jgi:hypothetical protein